MNVYIRSGDGVTHNRVHITGYRPDAIVRKAGVALFVYVPADCVISESSIV